MRRKRLSKAAEGVTLSGIIFDGTAYVQSSGEVHLMGTEGARSF